MHKYFEWLIGLRYLTATGRAGENKRFLSVISSISMTGIALGVAVLLVVLSVMNGFERELRERILSVTAHATISGDGVPLLDWQQVRDQVIDQPGVEGVAPFIEQQALLLSADGVGGSANSGVVLRGIYPQEETKVANIAAHMRAGQLTDLKPGEYGIVLGAELAKELNVQVGDRVVAVIAKGTVTVAGVLPRSKRFKVLGVFGVGMYEYDRHYAYVQMQDAAKLYGMGDGVTGIRLKLDNVFESQRIALRLARQLGGGYAVDDWTRKHANFFRSIAMTKSMMFLILLLIVAVAAFNVVATLVMVVKDKQSDIAILRTLGATPRSVLAMFAIQGTLIGVIGVSAGVLLGSVLSWNLESLIHLLERVFNTRFMDAKLYFMSDLPAAVQWQDVVKVAAVSFAMCCLATLYPAWRASRTEPARALRHE